ncbi:putative RNA recognition motif domain, nucleotide-binding alpha-beta plait domain superfamily [Helianthus annuus]|uniref:RNA recognition motif domain, nucleotide-binding alpha-beta plait domain superfamily n=1 Tax=Helianthus annuus TaxID=4232 RepID=A0A9K3HV55_HELAN|nr:putative RNA recognition motif domain, nucleotide-binding alpha-beta plait domain superfamily [Helianthus annuus]KAJ0512844.1 putative RNA recognition motif domain, nucleotide-binding alpha-beta plait domain superfamily [Helianthus annuus]KAJ0528968.1 putative RNA recognition motif domain, nucleotide-binding alpha-beta plait domain superfamily [Helianthus annuus]KAJ0695884.1 putative RNA recognition motif domain, nucleotide-binding alpha-beta plait domain superfamily [Helianthus annuus]
MGREDDNGGPWHEVQYRKNRKSKGDGVEWTFLIQNLADKVNRNILWRAFQQYGFISDVYVARKRDARGRCFGFVRYVGVQNMEETLASMNAVKMFGMKAMVSLAKYDKDHKKFNYSPDTYVRSEWRPKEPTNSVNNRDGGTNVQGNPSMKTCSSGPSSAGTAFVHNGISYADRVRSNHQGNTHGAKVVTVESKGALYPLHCIGRSIIGYVKEMQSISNIRKALSAEGLVEVGLSYIGGVMFMITCNDKAGARDCLEKHSAFLHKMFSKVFIWNGEDIPLVHLVDLRIIGVPFLVRDGLLYDKIGNQFGEVIQKSSFSWQNEDNSTRSVKIVTSCMAKIDEVVVIKWNEKTVTVRVVESCEQYLFNCDTDSSTDSSDSELESESEDDEGPVDMEDAEEGEIRENPSGDYHNQTTDAQPASVEEEPPTGGNETAPVVVDRLPEVHASPAGQELNGFLGNVEKCNMHGEGVHVSICSNINDVNLGMPNKSTPDGNDENSGPNNNTSGERSSGPNNLFDGEDYTPAQHLGKRNRDERSPPSFGSIQGPAQRPVYQSHILPDVQIDLNSPLGDNYGLQEVFSDLPESHGNNRVARDPGRADDTRDTDPVENRVQIEPNQLSDLKEEVRKLFVLGLLLVSISTVSSRKLRN